MIAQTLLLNKVDPLSLEMRKLPPFLFQPFFSGVTSLKMGIMLLQPPTTTMMVVVPSSISVSELLKNLDQNIWIYYKSRLLFRKELENAGKGAWKKQKKELKKTNWVFVLLFFLYSDFTYSKGGPLNQLLLQQFLLFSF